jgi:hypothetical protein
LEDDNKLCRETDPILRYMTGFAEDTQKVVPEQHADKQAGSGDKKRVLRASDDSLERHKKCEELNGEDPAIPRPNYEYLRRVRNETNEKENDVDHHASKYSGHECSDEMPFRPNLNLVAQFGNGSLQYPVLCVGIQRVLGGF